MVDPCEGWSPRPPVSTPLLYLSATDAEQLMPAVGDRIQLARYAMTSLVGDAELPPKLAVHPRPDGSFAHAMPASLRGAGAAPDLLGMKWVAGFPTNSTAGLPAIHGTVVLNDPHTGVPLAMVDAGPVTSHRTAAVSGVAIDLWARARHRPVSEPTTAGPVDIAMVGAGVQARSHLPVLAHLLPGSSLVVHDRHPERAEAVCRSALEGGFRAARSASDAESAIEGADLVITMLPFGGDRQRLRAQALSAASLIVAVDYDMSIPAAVASGVSLFLVDEAKQFQATRAGGVFKGYPDPDMTLGVALDQGAAAPSGRTLVTHLGVGLADLVFADALRRAALEQGIGTLLPP